MRRHRFDDAGLDDAEIRALTARAESYCDTTYPDWRDYSHQQWTYIARAAWYGDGAKNAREKDFIYDVLELLIAGRMRKPTVRQAAWVLDIHRRRKDEWAAESDEATDQYDEE